MKSSTTSAICRTIFLVILIAGTWGCGEKPDSNEDVWDKEEWYCGPKHKPRAIKATLINHRYLRISGKGAMMDYKRGERAPYRSGVLTNDLVIENGVTHIGRGAFCELDNLESVTISNSVKTIADVAFSGCTKLTSITIPNGVETIGDGVFYNCTNLTEVTLPNSVKTIGEMAFTGCINLSSITIPSSVTSIGFEAFKETFAACDGDGCHDLSITVAGDNVNYSSEDGVLFNKEKTTLIQYRKCGDYTIPNSVRVIGERAFVCSNNLTSVTFPGSVKIIKNEAFYFCRGLTAVTIGEGVTLIEKSAFYGCSNLTSVTIPRGVTSIENSVFSSCFNLTSVTIPNSVKIIKGGAFSSCTSLTSVTIPSSVTSIEDHALWGCEKLTSVTVLNPIPPNVGNKVFNDDLFAKVCLYVHDSSIAAYRADSVWNKIKCIKAITAGGKI